MRYISNWWSSSFICSMHTEKRRVVRIEAIEPRVLLAATLVKDIFSGTDSSSPSDIAEFDGLAFFSADSLTGRELWSSDGTAANTKLVENINPDGNSDPNQLTRADDRIYFSADDGTGNELWWSDGTSAGTRGINLNTGGASDPDNFIYLPGKSLMIFSADGGTGRQLWRSNGTVAGTVPFNSPPVGSNPGLPVLVNDNLFVFWARTDAEGYELWRSDGTDAGTFMLPAINPGPDGSGPTTGNLVGNNVFFSASDGVHGFELWKTDGSSRTFVADINPGSDPDPLTGDPVPHSSFPVGFVDVGGIAVFRADTEDLGRELWRSTGTGAQLVEDINPGPGDSQVVQPVLFNGKMYFRANDGSAGNELWVSDGTIGGTKIVRDIFPGPVGSGVLDTTVVGDLLYFTADGGNGTELWQTDGTNVGTLETDIRLGGSSSNPTNLANVSDVLFLSADDGLVGQELWATGSPVVTHPPVVAEEGKAFSGPVYTFAPSDTSRLANEFTAQINWGDGATSAGTIKKTGSSSNARFIVSGTHLYKRYGGYPIVVTVTDTKKKTSNTGAVNLSKASGNQAEGTIAIDPTNPDRIYARSNTDSLGDFNAYTTDGGVTWTRKFVGKGTDGLPRAAGDPKAVFDQYGNLFVTILEADTKARVALLLSTNGGKSFKKLTTLNTFPNPAGEDQPSLAVGPGKDGVDGSVWVAFKAVKGRIVVAGAPVTGLGQVGSFTSEQAPGSQIGNFGDVSVGPDGEVVANWQTDDKRRPGVAQIYVTIDVDGLGPAKLSPDRKVTDTFVDASYSIPSMPTREIDAEANLAFDRSNGTWRGRLYMSYTDAAERSSDDTNIYVRWSDDSGFTWSKPVKVNNDKTKNSQILPSISVDDSTGRVAIFWHDARNDKNNVLTEPWVSMSNDGGATWTPNVRLHSGQSSHENGKPPVGFNDIDYGDYTSVSLYKDALFPVWADNSKTLGGNPKLPQFDLATNRITIAQVSDGAITASGRDAGAVRYRTITPTVATFLDANKYGALSEFSAVIDWGDGTSSKGTITKTGKRYFVKGSHVYKTTNPSATITTTIKSIGGSTATTTSLANILDPVPTPALAVGPGAGSKPTVMVIDPRTGVTFASIAAYGTKFTGGVRVAVGDVNGDGFLDVITAPGAGSGAAGEVRVFDGLTLNRITGPTGTLVPYGADFVTGINVATGDVNGDNHSDIIVAADIGSRQRVRIFSGADGALIQEFFAYDVKFTGAVNVAAGDIDGDGKVEVIAAPGAGLPRQVRIFNGETAGLIRQFYPLGNKFKIGMTITTGQFDSVPGVDIGVAAANGGEIKVFSGVDNASLFSDTPLFPATPSGGLHLAAWDSNADGLSELITAGGADDEVLPVRLSGAGDTRLDLFPFGNKFKKGMFVAVGNV